MDNVHPLSLPMGGQISKQMVDEQRRSAAVQLAIQSLHSEDGYDNHKLIARAHSINDFIEQGS